MRKEWEGITLCKPLIASFVPVPLAKTGYKVKSRIIMGGLCKKGHGFKEGRNVGSLNQSPLATTLILFHRTYVAKTAISKLSMA